MPTAGAANIVCTAEMMCRVWNGGPKILKESCGAFQCVVDLRLFYIVKHRFLWTYYARREVALSRHFWRICFLVVSSGALLDAVSGSHENLAPSSRNAEQGMARMVVCEG